MSNEDIGLGIYVVSLAICIVGSWVIQARNPNDKDSLEMAGVMGIICWIPFLNIMFAVGFVLYFIIWLGYHIVMFPTIMRERKNKS